MDSSQPQPASEPAVPASHSGGASVASAASEASDVTDVAIAAAGFDDEDEEEESSSAAPGHLHALSRGLRGRLLQAGHARHHSESKLAGRGGSLGGSLEGGARRSRSTSRGASRGPHGGSGRLSLGDGGGGASRSSSPSRGKGPAPDAAPGYPPDSASRVSGMHSAQSSLDGRFHPDLLLDRLGFVDLDPPLPHEICCGPLGAPGALEGNVGGLAPVHERLSAETLDDCHAFSDLVAALPGPYSHAGGSTVQSLPSVAHSSLSGMTRSDLSVGSGPSVGSFKDRTAGGGGGHSRGGSVAGGSLLGDGENSVRLGPLDEEGEDEESVTEARLAGVKETADGAAAGRA